MRASNGYSRFTVLAVLFAFGVVCLLSLVEPSEAFSIVVPAREEECVYENAKAGYAIHIRFQVLSGGHQDVDVKFTFRREGAPAGEEDLVLMAQRRTEEKYTFTAVSNGEYKFCFGNLMSLTTNKIINVATSVTVPRSSVVVEYIDPIDEVVRQLASYVDVVRDEQTQMKQRDVVTSNLADSTNAQVLYYSIGELVILFFCVGYQIYNIQRMFEVKRQM